MAHLVFILAALGLLAGFLALMRHEARRGARVFARERGRFDQKVAHIEFILAHVDFAAFARDEMRRAGVRIGHDIVHFSLQVVRTVERILTQLVRHLRTTHGVDAAPRETARPFVQTLSNFKDQLKSARSDAPDIQH